MKEILKSFLEFADFEWMIEEGADEKLQREVEEQLKFAELERMMMQEEQEAGDLQVIYFGLIYTHLSWVICPNNLTGCGMIQDKIQTWPVEDLQISTADVLQDILKDG